MSSIYSVRKIFYRETGKKRKAIKGAGEEAEKRKSLIG